MNKTILILGGNNFFIGLIKAAKKLNYKVISIDRNKDSIAKYYADEFHKIDFSKYKQVFNFAKKKNINGITTHQSDVGVYSVGYVNNKLNLSGANLELSKICSSKSLTRTYLNKNINQPKYLILKNLKNLTNKVETFGFPCILKPSKSSASRGIKIFRSKNDLKKIKNYKSEPSNKEFVLEQFIDGIEFGSQVLVIAGKIKKIFTHNDIFLNKKTPVPIGHSFPSKLNKKTQKKIEAYITNLVKLLKIKSSVLNLDFILGNNNKIYLLEIGLRCGATCIPDLIKHHSGVDWETIIVKMAMKKNINTSELKNKTLIPIAGEIFLSKKKFVLHKMIIPRNIDKDIVKVDLDKQPKFTVNTFKNGTDRFGYILTKAKNVYQAEKLCKYYKNKIKFN